MHNPDAPLHKLIWYVATLAISANAFFIKRLVETQDTISARVQTVHENQAILEVKISVLADKIEREIRYNHKKGFHYDNSQRHTTEGITESIF